ncbi:rhamnogalacturonan lyase [Isoptericola nanjingensis]|uniref:rhamnogalacturonan lyase n=1 Tax=Isoptericola nanjingensis TaxID=903413 RepID=UPI003D191265
MNRARRLIPTLLATGALLACGGLPAASADAAAHRPADNDSAAPFQLEQLDRGLVAVSTDEGVFLSWRLLGSEASGTTKTGLKGPDFVVYRDGKAIGTVTESTNFSDPDGSATSSYTVAPVVSGVELEASDPVTAWQDGHRDVPLQKPSDGVTPAGEAYSYVAYDASAADVDGDGAYELVVLWNPTNEKDVSLKGYTGNVYLDTYELDGTLLNRLDMGVNIRAGQHYTQFMVYDFDGDGRSETMLKTAPGTKSTGYDAAGDVTHQDYITMPKSDIAAGYANTDDYRLSAEGYQDHLASMFEGWSDHPEVKAGNWPATVEDALGIPVTHDYPLSTQDAEELADYFIDVYAPSRSPRNELRKYEGFILDGPEYLSVFDSTTGKELQTIPYKPGRGDDGLSWGDYAMNVIEPGNRVDRFIAGVAYLDGKHPSAVFARGYYTRMTMATYDWDGNSLRERWYVDSGHVPMSNPFNDLPHGREGSDPVWGRMAGQGFHSMSAADVDGDGKQEIVYGSATLDDDGSVLYSSYGTLPEGSAAPGKVAKLGHGDGMYVTDIDPSRPGLEIFSVHENARNAPYGAAMRDAATGEVLFGAYSGKDTGNGLIGDVRPDVPGIEAWASMPTGTTASGLLSAHGEILSTEKPDLVDATIHFGAEPTTQTVSGDRDGAKSIVDWQRGTLLHEEDTAGNPPLVADIVGDWREELLIRTKDSTALRIFTTTELTTHKLTTLMHDKQYRAEIARQNTVYNYPTQPGFYLASDTDWSKVPILTTPVTPKEPRFIDKRGQLLDLIVIPKSTSVDYYVDGKKVRAGVHRAPRSEATVAAVPKPFFAIDEDAAASWTHDFSHK